MARESPLRRVAVRVVEALVLACGLSRPQRAYVADGLRRVAECRFYDGFDEMELALASLSRCDAVVLARQDHHARAVTPVIHRIARDWPATAIVVFCSPGSDAAPSLHTLAVAGADEFVFEGVADTGIIIARKVEMARRARAAGSVLTYLLPLLPGELHTFAQLVVSRPERHLTVEDVARGLGVHRKTLVNRCARAAFLQPAELIVWCRLAMVGHALGNTGATVESIALDLGFPSHTSLRNYVRKYIRQTATEVRRSGGLSAVLAAFEKRIAAWREEHLPNT